MNLMNIEQANRISLVELMTELGFNPVKINKANVYYQSL